MSINIKEIFQSDNLSTSQDKINYNFDQILANGGGPLGLKGDKGTTGAIGSIGPKGNKGEIGGTGAKGSTGADGYWNLESFGAGTLLSPYQHTLLPKIQPTSGSNTGGKPTNLVLGVDDTSYTLDSIDKNALISLVSGNASADWSDIIRIRIRNTNGTFNDTSAVVRLIPGTAGARLKIATIGGMEGIEVASNNIDLIGNDTSLIDGNGLTKLRITNGYNEAAGTWNFLTGSSINIAANSTAITLKNDGNSSLLGNNIFGGTGKTNQITGTTNTITGTNIITGAEFRINPTGASPALNKVLVSQDTNGKALWKNPTEVMGMYPIGTIVYVNPADIIETNFELTDAGGTLGGGTVSMRWHGRGKVNTRWGGWYLLFGQTNAWYNSSGTLITYVPTNIPGSIPVGGASPNNTLIPDSLVPFDSSMGINNFRPPTGYGTDYNPSLRGSFNGVPFDNDVSNLPAARNPGDLLTSFVADGGTDRADILNQDFGSTASTGPLKDVTVTNSGSTLGYTYSRAFSFISLPMAIYLGSTSYGYKWEDLSGDPDGTPDFG
jgi:hypothetical protein